MSVSQRISVVEKKNTKSIFFLLAETSLQDIYILKGNEKNIYY